MRYVRIYRASILVLLMIPLRLELIGPVKINQGTGAEKIQRYNDHVFFVVTSMKVLYTIPPVPSHLRIHKVLQCFQWTFDLVVQTNSQNALLRAFEQWRPLGAMNRGVNREESCGCVGGKGRRTKVGNERDRWGKADRGNREHEGRVAWENEGRLYFSTEGTVFLR